MPVAAAVVGNDGIGAVLAARDMAAERHRAAALDGRDYLQLVEADVPGIGAAPRRPMVAEDIRNHAAGSDRRYLSKVQRRGGRRHRSRQTDNSCGQSTVSPGSGRG